MQRWVPSKQVKLSAWVPGCLCILRKGSPKVMVVRSAASSWRLRGVSVCVSSTRPSTSVGGPYLSSRAAAVHQHASAGTLKVSTCCPTWLPCQPAWGGPWRSWKTPVGLMRAPSLYVRMIPDVTKVESLSEGETPVGGGHFG